MLNASSIITEFVLERLDGEPIAKRIQLTRAIAAIAGNAKERAELNAIADELESVERRQRKLTLNYKERRV